MLEKKVLCFISTNKSLLRSSLQYKNLFEEFSRNFEKIYILNLANLRIFEDKINSFNDEKALFPNNFEILKFDNSSEFINFAKDRRIIAITNELSKSPSNFKIFYLLKKINAFLISINTNGRIGGKISFDFKFKKIFKAKKHLYLKGFYYFWRILTVINLFPKIDILFTCNKDDINIFNNGFSKKVEKITGLKVFLYRKIINVNSDSIDKVININKIPTQNENNEKDKYIIFADTPINHLDRVSREGEVSSEELQKYYLKVFEVLNNISKELKKKVIITIHPNKIKNPEEEMKVFENSKNFIMSSKRTIEIINKADVFVFTVSSAVTHALMLKKKIINLNSKFLGDHFSEVGSKYVKYLNLLSINIDEKNHLPKNYNFLMIESIKKYENFIKNRLSDGSDIPSYKKITQEILKI